MPEDYFGERVAERFDERYAHLADAAVVDPIVAFIADLARGGAALELGIGTGRIALPSRSEAYAYTGSICRRLWSRGCVRSRGRSRSA